MADLERTYNIPLRKGIMKVPKYKRANKAIRVVREFLQRHMKSQTVKLGPNLNSKILEHGRKNVPHHIEVKTVKDKDNIVKAELASAKDLSFLEPKKEEKEEKVKLKIPGLGKKKTEENKEPEKEKALEKPSEEIEKKITKEERAPEVKVDKEKSIMTKEDKVYGRSDKKPKVKERAKKYK
ncbi:MAG: 50S ribosomal protein L31e [Candidatus Woesearchaeota archaeon]